MLFIQKKKPLQMIDLKRVQVEKKNREHCIDIKPKIIIFETIIQIIFTY